MDPPPVPNSSELSDSQTGGPSRSQSFSQTSNDSHTAAEFIDSQLKLEADAREALPYALLKPEDVAKIGGTRDASLDWARIGMNQQVEVRHRESRRLKDFYNPITEVAESVVDGEAMPDAQNESNVEEDVEAEQREDDDPPLPPGFPDEDNFEGFICYKCVDAHPWLKQYAGASGFLPPVFRRSAAPSPEAGLLGKAEEVVSSLLLNVKKRKADDEEGSESSGPSKRVKDEDAGPATSTSANPVSTTAELAAKESESCKVKVLPPAPRGQMSLFFKSDFRDHLCRCSDCFPLLKLHSQLLEEETIYEPSMSGSGEDAEGSTVGSGSLYDRGESALKNVDRVRAIEGVMAYNHLKDKLKPFFQQFAESGKAISAEDIKAHFEKMRGDEQAIREAGEGAKNADNRKEQSGY